MLRSPTLDMAASLVDDLEKLRIANMNRIEVMVRSDPDEDGIVRGWGMPVDHPDVERLRDMVTAIKTMEDSAIKYLEKSMKDHPLGKWVASQRGIGNKQAARLLAIIGDPYVNEKTGGNRTVGQLWAYCVPRGELVSTPNGSIPIETIKIGDFVYNRSGRSTVVENVLTREINEEITVIRAAKALPLRITQEHPILVAQLVNKNGHWQRSSLTWKKASDVATGEHLVIPKLDNPLGLEISESLKGKKSIKIKTIPPELALQLQLFMTKLNCLPDVHVIKKANKQARYHVYLSETDIREIYNHSLKRISPRYQKDEDYFYVPVMSVTNEHYEGTVYDLSCGGSFLVNNIVVHNCGLDVRDGKAPRHTKGVQSNWNSKARSRAWLIAQSCLKSGGPYKEVYDKRKAHCQITHPEWRPFERHRDAVRVMMKEILKRMWIAAREIHLNKEIHNT